MSILEQDEIDRLQRELANLDKRKDLALRAREKIRDMYLNIMSVALLSDLETLEEIGDTINRINLKITHKSKHYDSFNLLKQSYQRRL